jgi:hypothetical protein
MKKSILDFFTASSPDDNNRLSIFKKKLNNEYVYSWYPSAEFDFRDLIELTINFNKNNFDGKAPDIFIHSDYRHKFIEEYFEKNKKCTINNAIIEFKNKINFQLNSNPYNRRKFDYPGNNGLTYFLDKDFIGFKEDALYDLKLSLIEVEITNKDNEETFNKIILFFYAENNALLEGVLLKLKELNLLNLQYIIKVREGINSGGGTHIANISYSYLFTNYFGLRYILTDAQQNTLEETAFYRVINNSKISDLTKEEIIKNYKDFSLVEVNEIKDFTKTNQGYDVKIFKTIPEKNNSVENIRRLLTFR